MKTLADIKKRATWGAKLTMIRHDWYPHGPLIGVERFVRHVQGNGIGISASDIKSPISWLYWKKASEIKVTGPDTFTVQLGDDPKLVMEYRFG